jgi:hypothetical protein
MTNLMLSDDVTVTMPHRASEEELAYYESRLNEQLATIKGLENPKVRIVSRATTISDEFDELAVWYDRDLDLTLQLTPELRRRSKRRRC